MRRRIHACHMRRRIHACHMRRRIHACHMRRRIHACRDGGARGQEDQGIHNTYIIGFRV
jgi:hypothetical protein